MTQKILAIFLMTCLAIGSVSEAQMGKDTKHVSDDSFLVIHVNVERLIGQLKKSKEDFENMARMMQGETPFDLRTIKSLTLQFGDSDVDEGEPSFAATVEFSKDIDKEKLLAEFAGSRSYEEKTINGKTYLSAGRPTGPHMYFESKRKFTAATQGGIESILKGGGGMGRMASRLKSAPPNAELIAVFHRSAEFQNSTQDIFDNLTDLPLPIKLSEIMESVESGYAFFDFASGNPMHLEVMMKTADAADKTKAGLDSLVTLGKASIAPTKAMLKEQMKNLEGAEGFQKMQRDAMQVGVDGLDVAEKILGGSKTVVDSRKVVFDVQHMGGLTEIADLAASGFSMMFLGVQRIEGPGGGLDAPPKAAAELKLEKKK